jgi:vesicle-fusing ATPase
MMLCTRHDDTGKLKPGQIGASAFHRQWIGLSVTGDSATVEALPPPPHPAAPLFLQSIDIEVGFFRPNQTASESFSVDDMGKILVKAYSGISLSMNQGIAFEFRGMPIKGMVKGLSVLELADEQRKGLVRGGGPASRRDSGILMGKTDITIMKDPTSQIKFISSSKK